MKFSQKRRIWRILVLGLSLGGGVGCLAQSSAARDAHTSARAISLSADQVIQKAVERAQKAENPTARGYTYTKVTLTEEFDTDGKMKERKERTYQVCFKGGSTEVKLVAVNGGEPGVADLRLNAEKEANFQRMVGSSKSGSSERRDTFLTAELVARFDFKLLDRKALNGRAAYRIEFAPKSPEPPVHHIVDRVLNRVSGTLWIDAEEFEIARAEIQLGSEVNLLGGVIGSLKKLAYTLTRTRLADGVWLSTFSTGDFEGRKLWDSKHIKTQSRSTNFQPVSAG